MRVRLCDQNNHKKWDTFIPEILFTTRRRPNASTGMSPSMLLFGHDLNRPGERTNEYAPPAGRRIADARRHQERCAPTPEKKEYPQIIEGDRVYIRGHQLSNADHEFSASLAS